MNATAELRRAIYLILTVVATAIATAKVIGVENVWEPSRFTVPNRVWPKERPSPTPMFGSNDKSRWATVRALVDEGTFKIGHRENWKEPSGYTDRGIIFDDGWTSIDKVMNPATGEFYSSKPPLYAVLLAGEYWALKKCFGWQIATDRWPVVISILLTVNVLPFAIALIMLAKLIETHGTTDFSKLLAFATAAFGTFLVTFSNTLNNHTPATCCVVFAIYPLLRSSAAPSRWALFLSGFFAALTATFDLPAASFVAALIALAALRVKGRVLWMLLGMIGPVVSFALTNYLSLGKFTPAYGEFGGEWYNFPGSHWARLELVKQGTFVPGIDFATESRGVYLFHCLLGHHGWFSLTPIWFVGLVGCVATLKQIKGDALAFPLFVQLAWLLTFVLIVFFVYVQKTNNYGGNTSGLRWFFWLTPLWVIAVLAGADRISNIKWARVAATLLLGLSVMSAFYPAWNPWRSPWLLVLCEQMDWVNYDRN